MCIRLHCNQRTTVRIFLNYNAEGTSTNDQQIFKNPINCINVKFGFEGDLSEDKRRGISNGWKFSGLPWKQS